MKKLRNITKEISKYPYYARRDDTKSTSQRNYVNTQLELGKKVLQKCTGYPLMQNFILTLANGLSPNQAMGLPILTTTPSRMNGL